MRGLALLLLLAAAPLPGAVAQATDVLPAEDDEALAPAAMESTEPPTPPTLAGANGALLFAAFGASLGAVIALGRYHKKRRPPSE